MRSKNTDTCESQNQSFRYTMLAVIGVLIVMAALAWFLGNMRGDNGLSGTTQDPLDMTAVPPSIGQGTPAPDDVSASQTVPSVDSRDNTGGSAIQDPGGTHGTSSYGFDVPVKGPVIKEFSPETPVYSRTLDQYCVHMGVDFEAAADTQVQTIDEGTVISVHKDDRLGLTIVIDHGDGYVSKYSNLSTDKLVEPGDVVTRGQVISGVGNSALFESLDPEHLHFELWKDGQAVDPAEYL